MSLIPQALRGKAKEDDIIRCCGTFWPCHTVVLAVRIDDSVSAVLVYWQPPCRSSGVHVPAHVIKMQAVLTDANVDSNISIYQH